MKKHNYIGRFLEYLMIIVKVRFSILLKALFLFLISNTSIQVEVKASDIFSDDEEISSFAYDEFPVLVIVEGYSNFYVDALYANNDLLYVNIAELFQTLNIPCTIEQEGEGLGGIIDNGSQAYLVDYYQRQIKVGDKIISTKNGLVKEMSTLYMESSLFAEAFGITLTFNYRALTIILKSDFELPVVKQQREEKMRSNMSKVKGEDNADTVILRNYHLFRFGMVDWSVASYQTWKEPADNRIGLGVGAELFHGEADVSVLYYDRYKFDNRQLYYLWRWVDNDKKIIKQAQLGRISNQSISFINSPVIGAIIRNSPTTVRKATGYYTISEFTEPNWTIELYINNVMVDYTKADASGLYVFKVPNIYGYTTLKLKFYGPLGEERTEERTMNVPYTVMPAHQFEYSLSAGVLQDSSFSRYGKGEFNYGVNRILTVGGGLEYLSSIPNSPFIPFLKTTIQPFSKLTLTGEYAHGVKTRGLLDYYFWKDALLEIEYTKFVDGQLATRFNAGEERKVKLSVPFRIKRFIGFSKFDYTQLVYKGFNYNQANAMVSIYYMQFSASSSTQFNWINNQPSYTTSVLSLSYRLGKGFMIRTSAQHNISENKLMSYKAAIEKSIPRGYVTIAYQRDLLFDDHLFSLNFRYDLSFARTNFSVTRSKNKTYTSESAQGSLAFGSGNKHTHASNNPSVGKGGLSLYPFLDLNQNGIFDEGEHMVKLTSVKVMGSKAIFSEKDSIVRIPNLYAFTNCIIEFNDNDLENIAWRFKNKKYQVLIDPNQFKRIDIPIIAVGEVSGMMYLNSNNTLKGIGRIMVKFYEKNSTALVAETLSESDGYISYLGLEPGEYVARIDSVQLNNLNFKTDPQILAFEIKVSEEGDIVDGVEFVLTTMDTIEYRNDDLINSQNQMQPVKDSIAILNVEQISGQDSQYNLIWGENCTQIGHFCIQCGAFRNIKYAMRMALYIKQSSDLSVGIILHHGLYKVRVACVTKKREAVEIKARLKKEIVCEDMFIVIRK